MAGLPLSDSAVRPLGLFFVDKLEAKRGHGNWNLLERGRGGRQV